MESIAEQSNRSCFYTETFVKGLTMTPSATELQRKQRVPPTNGHSSSLEHFTSQLVVTFLFRQCSHHWRIFGLPELSVTSLERSNLGCRDRKMRRLTISIFSSQNPSSYHLFAKMMRLSSVSLAFALLVSLATVHVSGKHEMGPVG